MAKTNGYKFALMMIAALPCVLAEAFPAIPKESAKALGVTRGRPFSKGAVFISGKYIEPPYVVERWGTGIRINQMPVTGQVIDWTEFMKTQSGVKVTKTETPVAEPVIVSSPVSSSNDDDLDASSLDDLFDDDPKPAKKKPVVRKYVPPKPKTTVSYSLDGDFVPNEASKALLTRINQARTDIDRQLRSGGFICFGENYSQVNGDSRTFKTMLESLPELEQRSQDLESFRSGVRAANLVYLNEILCEELFENRIDYRKLQERRKRLEREQQWDKVLEDVSNPLF